MVDLARRLIEDAIALVLQGEGKIELLIKRRGVTRIEAGDILERCPADEHGGADDAIDLADEIQFRQAGVQSAPVGIAPAVAEDRAAGLLHGAVVVEQLAADHAAPRHPISKIDERLEPAPGDDRIVVEEEDEFLIRDLGRTIAGAQEAEILGVGDDLDAG